MCRSVDMINLPPANLSEVPVELSGKEGLSLLLLPLSWSARTVAAKPVPHVQPPLSRSLRSHFRDWSHRTSSAVKAIEVEITVVDRHLVLIGHCGQGEMWKGDRTVPTITRSAGGEPLHRSYLLISRTLLLVVQGPLSLRTESDDLRGGAGTLRRGVDCCPDRTSRGPCSPSGSTPCNIPLIEESMLADRFGGDYEEYCRHVPRLVPRLRPWTGRDQ